LPFPISILSPNVVTEFTDQNQFFSENVTEKELYIKFMSFMRPLKAQANLADLVRRHRPVM